MLCLLACTRGEHRDARVAYNAGVAALAAGDFEAATRSLLDARSRAGFDPELRFRAAYDLGLAYLGQADKLRASPDADLAKALDLVQQALSWFGDAKRQRPDHAATETNLRIARARMQALSDELRKGEGALEARIDRAIAEQRAVLDGVRYAWLAIKQAGGGDPLAKQRQLVDLADTERGIVAEIGAISDLATDEIDTIARKPEDKRSDEERTRIVQLKNVEIFLNEGRTRIADARRKLQDLAAQEALSRAEAALVALKRAREQLLDPITILSVVAQEELALVKNTLDAGAGAKLELGGDGAQARPAWLEPEVLADRQSGLRDRLEEVKARLTAASLAPEQTAPQETEKDPEVEKLLARVRIALPFVGDASAAMDRARQAFAERQLDKALEHERLALVALARAIEEFADLKKLVELAYADQLQILALLGPEAAKQLPAAQRATETKDAIARNLGRMDKLQGLIADEVGKLAQQAEQIDAQAAAAGSAGSAAGSASPDPQAQAEAAKQQLDAAKQRLQLAETLRGEAKARLDALTRAIADNKDPMTPATEAKTKIEELRELFFSVIEHLQQLIRDQGETRDQTAAAMADDPLTQAPKLPNLIGREDTHVAMAKAVTDALAQQADERAKQPQQTGGGPDAKTLSAAADEVRLAQTAMTDARATLVKARDATKSTESLEPGVESQATAVEHIENALRLLQPPKQQQQKDKQDQQQQQPQQQQKQEDSQPQAGAAQRARDRDAEQQRKRREQEAASDPVEKDW
jgi:hypothetical protein